MSANNKTGIGRARDVRDLQAITQNGQDRRSKCYLGPAHPLAEVAVRLCGEQHGFVGAALLGGVACGRCWEQAIRADERFVVECSLEDAEPLGDEEYLDEVALERACRGERVGLTLVERTEAVRRLTVAGLSAVQIAARLHTNSDTVRAIRARLQKQAPHGTGAGVAA